MLQSVRDDTMRALEARGPDRSKPRSESAGVAPEMAVQLKEQTRRLDDSESRLATLRVRIDAHEGRFGTLNERVEASVQQATDAARQVAAQQREEILMETDCQLRMLRQRVETLSQLTEEIMVQQAPGHAAASLALHSS